MGFLCRKKGKEKNNYDFDDKSGNNVLEDNTPALEEKHSPSGDDVFGTGTIAAQRFISAMFQSSNFGVAMLNNE
jgi:hypothetical protein